MSVALAAALWLAPGILSAGMMNHYWKRRWPLLYGRRDWIASMISGLLGPLDLVPTIKFVIARRGECPLGFSLSWTPQCGGEVPWENF